MVVPECCHLHESQAWLYESSLFYPLLMIHRLGFVGGQLSHCPFLLCQAFEFPPATQIFNAGTCQRLGGKSSGPPLLGLWLTPHGQIINNL